MVPMHELGHVVLVGCIRNGGVAAEQAPRKLGVNRGDGRNRVAVDSNTISSSQTRRDRKPSVSGDREDPKPIGEAPVITSVKQDLIHTTEREISVTSSANGGNGSAPHI